MMKKAIFLIILMMSGGAIALPLDFASTEKPEKFTPPPENEQNFFFKMIDLDINGDDIWQASGWFRLNGYADDQYASLCTKNTI